MRLPLVHQLRLFAGRVMHVPVIHQLRLLLWKSAKTECRRILHLLVQMLVPTFCILAMTYLIYAKTVPKPIASHRKGPNPILNPELLGSEPRIGTRLRNHDTFKYNCPFIDDGLANYEQCQAIRNQWNYLCGNWKNGRACNPLSVGMAYGMFLMPLIWTNTTLSVTVVNTDRLANSNPEIEFASEEFEMSRDLPYTALVVDRFVGSVLMMFALEHRFIGSLFIRHFPLLEITPESDAILFDTTNATSRFGANLITLLLPVIAALNLATLMGDERKSGMKDYLHTMGFSRLVYQLHHIIVGLVKNIVFILAVPFVIFYPNVEFAGLFTLTYFLYYLSVLAITILISVVVPNHKIVPDVLSLALPALLLLPTFLPVTRTDVMLSTASSFTPGYAMFNALDALRECSLKGGHLTWFEDIQYVLPFGVILIVQFLSTVFYMTIAVAFDHLSSSSFNVSKWISRYRSVSDEENNDMDIHEDPDAYEGLETAVELTDLHKTFPNGEHAVRGVNMNAYKGQITMLLGQNGAGKSTTFDMIAGITLPTSGTIKINGQPIENRLNYVIGLCPQYSPAFPLLTVKEHLYFFSRLSSGKWESEEPEEYIELLKLKGHQNKLAKTLSGGNLRKVCISMALIGDNKIVLLDEPSAGVDTECRIIIKEFLMKKKSEKTLLITTHYTDEAADMGDRICIMANGRIAVSGTQDFLNEKFNAGYRGSFVVAEKMMLESTANRALKLARSYIPATLIGFHGEEFELKLPTSNMERLGAFLRELENSMDRMGITQYGMSTAHLEDIFIKVAEQTGSMIERKKVDRSFKELLQENTNRASKWGRIVNSLAALIFKRLCFEWRNKFYQLFFYCLIFVSVYSGKGVRKFVDPGPYHDLMTTHQCGRYGFVNLPDLSAKFRRLAEERDLCIVVEDIEDADKWYNTTKFHRPPLIGAMEKEDDDYTMAFSYNRRDLVPLITNLFYSAVLGKNYNMTLRYRKEPSVRMELEKENLLYMFILCILMLSAMSRHVRSYVIEGEKGYAHLQTLTGTPRFLYWLGHFIVDSLVYGIFYTYLGIVCWYFDFVPHIFIDFLGQMVLCFYITLIQIAILHRFFDSKNTANTTVSILLLVSLLLLLPVYLTIQLKYPIFALETSFPLFINPFVAVLAYQSFEVLEIPANGPSIYVILFSQLAGFLFIFVLLDNRSVGKMFAVAFGKNRSQPRVRKEETNGDIEMQPLSKQAKAEDECGVEAKPNGVKNIALDVENITKSYKKKVGRCCCSTVRVDAVRGVTFGVDQNECFGMLGDNGAGKSSVFKIITGSIYADSGDALVSGVDCMKPAHIGYCPQDDALTNQLTGKEHLIVLAALHGYADPFKVATILIACVGMEKHCNKIFKQLSGGQKRKLSVSASILAMSKLIILDEPTSSIDAMVRNDIWNLLNSIRDMTSTAIVLTSHSMSEVEALCSRVAIMRQGLIVAHGTPQTLKSRYGDYLKLFIRVHSSNATSEEVKSVVLDLIYNAEFVSQNLASYAFKIPRLPSDSYAETYTLALSVAKTLKATNFSLVQSNLEDTFLALSE